MDERRLLPEIEGTHREALSLLASEHDRKLVPAEMCGGSPASGGEIAVLFGLPARGDAFVLEIDLEADVLERVTASDLADAIGCCVLREEPLFLDAGRPEDSRVLVETPGGTETGWPMVGEEYRSLRHLVSMGPHAPEVSEGTVSTRSRPLPDDGATERLRHSGRVRWRGRSVSSRLPWQTGRPPPPPGPRRPVTAQPL